MKVREFGLEDILLNFSGNGGNTPFTVRMACEGVSIIGSTGSGKSTGSFCFMFKKYLSYGMAGLVLCVKPGDKDTYIDYLRQTNRLQDMILVEPGGQYHFSFLEYEGAQKIAGRASSENLADLIETVINNESRGQSSDPFWSDSLRQLIVNVLDLNILAFDNVSVRSLYDIVLSVPRRGQKDDDKPKPHSFAHAFQIAKTKVEQQAKAFLETLPEDEKLKLSDEDYCDRLVITNVPEAGLFRSLDQYFNEYYKNLAEKTRGIIEISFINFLSQLLREPIYSIFCRQTNFTPEDTLNGKIIILNFPTKLYHKAGRDIQVSFKYIWQRAMERRNIDDNPRPCFLICDEAQTFIHARDSDFQATARSSRVCTVYVTQNLSSYHVAMGGYKSEHRVNSFLANLGCKIFHSNGHVETNKWASELVGNAYVVDESSGVTMGENVSSSRNRSYKLEAMMRPEAFTRLLAGGPRNNYLVEGVVHLQNTLFHDGLSFRKIIFKQQN